ncbi:MAG: YrdB family protein [Anaerolineae bacterium]|nr:YrdB family protein [Anaerolineae bacterium]
MRTSSGFVLIACWGILILLELCILAAVAYWGFQTGANLPIQLVLSISAPLLFVLLRGYIMVSVAKERWTTNYLAEILIFGVIPVFDGSVPTSARCLVTIISFGVSTIALVAADQPTLAVILAIAAGITHGYFMMLKYEGDWV